LVTDKNSNVLILEISTSIFSNPIIVKEIKKFNCL